MGEDKPKKLNLNLDADLVAWVSFASGLHDVSQTAYINDAIRRDRDSASEQVKAAYQLFLEARQV